MDRRSSKNMALTHPNTCSTPWFPSGMARKLGPAFTQRWRQKFSHKLQNYNGQLYNGQALQYSAWNENQLMGRRGTKKSHRTSMLSQEHRTADHLITLRVLMDECTLRGRTLFCCFVDFKKAFDIVPRGGLWKRMQEIGVPLALRVGISRIYKKVLCQLKQTYCLMHM